MNHSIGDIIVIDGKQYRIIYDVGHVRLKEVLLD